MCKCKSKRIYADVKCLANLLTFLPSNVCHGANQNFKFTVVSLCEYKMDCSESPLEGKQHRLEQTEHHLIVLIHVSPRNHCLTRHSFLNMEPLRHSWNICKTTFVKSLEIISRRRFTILFVSTKWNEPEINNNLNSSTRPVTINNCNCLVITTSKPGRLEHVMTILIKIDLGKIIVSVKDRGTFQLGLFLRWTVKVNAKKMKI